MESSEATFITEVIDLNRLAGTELAIISLAANINGCTNLIPSVGSDQRQVRGVGIQPAF
jgi:hypothetical protein